jgi:hypothetical protein
MVATINEEDLKELARRWVSTWTRWDDYTRNRDCAQELVELIRAVILTPPSPSTPSDSESHSSSK